MRALTPRRGIGLSFVLLFATTFAGFADALEVRTYIDVDDNPATGCSAVTASGPVGGMEQVLVATVDTGVNPHVIVALSRQVCSLGAFGAPIPVAAPFPAPWGAGDRNSTEHHDVIELYLPRWTLPNAYTIRLAFATSQGADADALLTAGGGPADPPIRFQIDEPIPALSLVATVLLGLLLAAGGALLSRRPAAAPLVVLLLVSAVGVAWAAVLLDGDPGDWQAMASCAHDPVGDAGPGTDIASAHACLEGDLIYLRLDAGRNATPAAVDDAVTTDEDAALLGNVLAANPATPDSDADLDALAVVAVNGDAAAVGAVVTLASAARVSVAASGEFSYNPNGAFASLCPGASTSDSFSYTVSDGRGASATATVTVTVTGSEYAGVEVEKMVNGFTADDAPGPVLVVGSPVASTYRVSNPANARLTSVLVTDDSGVAVTCPKTALEPGESMTCTSATTAQAGQHSSLATVTALTPCSRTVTSTDPAYYLGVSPRLTLVKYVNGQDANLPTGPLVVAGSAVTWTYAVTNAGDVRLTAVSVTDDQGVAVSCPKAALEPGESMTCTAGGTAVAGQYRNQGTATGSVMGNPAATASDPAHYFGIRPGIQIEKLVNGTDADTAPGPTLVVGSSVLWTYVVTNTGDVALTQVSVSDDHGIAVTCPKATLAAGETMTCTATGTATAGPYVNVGTATATAPAGPAVTATDPAHYLGVSPGTQGCVPGYWRNHTGSWPPTGYSPSQSVVSAFAQAVSFPTLASSTLLASLSFAGGSGVQGAAEIVLRAGVAALLNAAHYQIDYPRTPASVIADVNTALASVNRDSILALAAMLDADNNLGCPLL